MLQLPRMSAIMRLVPLAPLHAPRHVQSRLDMHQRPEPMTLTDDHSCAWCKFTTKNSCCRLYLGSEKRNGEVITDAANKWSNVEYFRLTGLREYAPYMMGGGCALGMGPEMRLS